MLLLRMRIKPGLLFLISTDSPTTGIGLQLGAAYSAKESKDKENNRYINSAVIQLGQLWVQTTLKLRECKSHSAKWNIPNQRQNATYFYCLG